MKFRLKIVILSAIFLHSSALTASPAGDFAISCAGSASWSDSYIDNGKPRVDTTGEQIFVVRPSEHTVERALQPRQEFDPICGSDKDENRASIAPGLITASSLEFSDEGATISCSLEIDRKNGTARYQMEFAFKSGNTNSWDWRMICVPIKIPIYDTSRNKF